MKYNLYLLIFFAGAISFFATSIQAQESHKEHDHSSMQHKQVNNEEKISFWTCSMHPQIKLKEPGKCPICGMNLIPVSQDEDSAADKGKVILKLSEHAQKLADIQTTRVVRKAVRKEVRLVGTIDYDETRLTHITAWVGGRIDRMFVDYTGIAVKKNDHMLEIYSPELISAQEELIQATKSLKKLSNSSSTLVKNSTIRSAKATEEKLLLLGLTQEQVQRIKSRRKVEDNVIIYAPDGGVVVEKNATEGMYVQKGTRIYSIADLSSLWVYLDSYESDLPWIRYGQKITFTTKALPGVTFNGTVSFISPIVNTNTRTTKVRVNVDNSKGHLKPGLFVKGTIKASVYGEGKVVNARLKGKFICPMHPEIVKNTHGQCSVCGMDLVSAKELGYLTEDTNPELPLIIPKSAPLITGTRAVVYVKQEDSTTFEARTIVLGPEAEGYFIVVDGLKENEIVVTNGAFKIDADLQIKGKQSMMNPEAIAQTGGHNHGEVKQINTNPNNEDHSSHIKTSTKKESLPEKLKKLLQHYLNLSEALASDNLDNAKQELQGLEKSYALQNIIVFNEDLLKFEGDNIEQLRCDFAEITVKLIPKLEKYSFHAFKAHCPMALDDKGAFWLQKGDKVRNPYFGASMLHCGSIEGDF